MRRNSLAVLALVVMLSAWGFADTVIADDAPLPMRTEQPIVYATPIPSMIILEFKLYDNKTWCRLYIEKAVWQVIQANGGELPAGADKGQLRCEQR